MHPNRGKIEAIDADEDITLVDVKKDEETFFKPDKDVEEPKKKRVVDETLLYESFKKLRAAEVLGSESTQEIPSNDLKEMTEEDVQNMLELILVSEFKVEALQVKYPIIDWEIHTKGSRTYWKIIRVGGIIESYQSFEDMLKGFDREDLVALWNSVKENFSSAVPSVDKEKALWVDLKILFEPDADDATATVKKVNDAVQLRALTDCKKLVVAKDIIRRDLHLDDADGVECLPNEEIFEELARMCYEKPPPKLTFHKTFFSAMVKNVDNPSKFLMNPHFLQVVLDNQVDDMSTHNTRYTSPALTQKVFANIRRAGKGFLGVETHLFASMLVQPQPHFEEVEEEVEMPIAPAPPSLTSAPSPPLQDPTLTPHATSPQYQPSIPHALPPQE
nr:hypothetical protein [Tanacetum cinerariifolium]